MVPLCSMRRSDRCSTSKIITVHFLHLFCTLPICYWQVRWGKKFNRYYEMKVENFMSTPGRNALDILSRKHLWTKILSSSSIHETEVQSSNLVADFITKLMLMVLLVSRIVRGLRIASCRSARRCLKRNYRAVPTSNSAARPALLRILSQPLHKPRNHVTITPTIINDCSTINSCCLRIGRNWRSSIAHVTPRS